MNDRRQLSVRFPLDVWDAMTEAMADAPRSASRNEWVVEACRRDLGLSMTLPAGVEEPVPGAFRVAGVLSPEVPGEDAYRMHIPAPVSLEDNEGYSPMVVERGGIRFVAEPESPSTHPPAPDMSEPAPRRRAYRGDPPEGVSVVVVAAPDGQCPHKNVHDHPTFGKVCDDCNTPKSAW